MAANIHTLTPAPSARTPILTSYTCPRCREMNHSFACRRCGWTPDVVVGSSQRDEELEDAAIAC